MRTIGGSLTCGDGSSARVSFCLTNLPPPLSYETVFDPETDKGRVGCKLQFAHDTPTVSSDGFGTQAELGGDGSERFSGTKEAEDLVLAVRERVLRPCRDAHLDIEHEFLCQLRAHVPSPAGDSANRLEQLRRRGILA